MNALEMKNATKHYDGFSLEGVNLALPEGAVMGLVGENGAGKSTTISLLLGLIEPDAGEIELLGVDSRDKHFDAVKQGIGAILDEAGFPEAMTARQLNRIMKWTYKNWSRETYDQYLTRFSLPLDKAYKDFSRGMKLKLMLAVALSHGAKLLILDEATSGLDPVVRDDILTILNDFTRDEKCSVLISSHIVTDLEKLCDYIAFIHKGRLLFCEEKDVLLDQYATLKCGRAEFENLDKAGVIGHRASSYGVEALVLRDKVPGALPLERAGIEDIMVLLAKGEMAR